MSFVVSKMSASKLHLRLRQIKNCAICGAEGATQKNGVYSCEGCADFYEKTIKKHKRYSCRFQENCPIKNNLPYQKICKCCRYKKCRSEGMKVPSNCLYLPRPTSNIANSYRSIAVPVANTTTASASTYTRPAGGVMTSAKSLYRPTPATTSAVAAPPPPPPPLAPVTVPSSAHPSVPSTSSPDIIYVSTAPPSTPNNRAQKDFISSLLILENCVFLAQLCPAFVLPYLRRTPEGNMLDVAEANFPALLEFPKNCSPVTERFYSLFVEASLRAPSPDKNDIQQIRMLLEQYIFASAEIIKTQIKSDVEFAALSQMTIIKVAGEYELTTETELTQFVNDCSESYRAFCRKAGEAFTDTKFWNLITATNKIHQYRQSTRKQVQQILKVEIPRPDPNYPLF